MKSRRITEAVRVIRAEANSLNALADGLQNDPSLSQAFSAAVDILMNLSGHLIVVGVGKSGHIGQKLAASFASTGTPAFFMHPTEASHGDLGMVTKNCAVLAISNSGESRELIDVLRYCLKTNVQVIGITRNPDSTLGRSSSAVLLIPKSAEACPNGLAPTTSTTDTLALGDALVVATMDEKGITESEFGARHPGGKLGRRLQTVEEWLTLNPHNPPKIAEHESIENVIQVMSEGRAGCVAVVSKDGKMTGMITDGDLRRSLDIHMFDKSARDIMTRNPVTISFDVLMSEVADKLSQKEIGNAFVVENDEPVGVMNLKQLIVQGYL